MLDGRVAPWPVFGDEERETVSRILSSGRVNYWTGTEGREFEREFASYCGADHAVALANGTVAIDLALIALGVGPGDDVIVTPRSFIASVSSVVNCGARPIFADVDLDSQNITAESVREVLTPSTKAIICVHLAGWPCDMDPILQLAADHGIKVIEDCAQAHGASYKGRPVGSLGDIAAWSFCQDKIISTAGEGGMVTTNDRSLWEKCWSYKDHGKSWERMNGRRVPNRFNWVHTSFGTNWRMTEIQSAVGRIQLRKLPEWHAARKANAERLARAMSDFPLFRTPIPPPEIEHAWYKFYAFVEPALLKPDWTRDSMIDALNERGAVCQPGSCSEIYLEDAFAGSGFAPASRLRNARQLGETSLMFVVHPTLTEEDIAMSCDEARRTGTEASR